MHWTIAKIGNQVAARPGLRIAATQRVFDPTSGDGRRAVCAAVLHNQLADASEIDRCGADATSAAGRAKAINRNLSRALRAHRRPEQGAQEIGESGAACSLQDPTQQVGIGRDIVAARHVRRSLRRSPGPKGFQFVDLRYSTIGPDVAR
jgi:hypothetical protein